MKKIRFLAPLHFEKWDYRALERGIGGSETNNIETSWHFAQRGYDVKVYAPLDEDCEREWRGTIWAPLEELDPTEEAVWIMARTTMPLEDTDFNGEVWIQMQDVDVAESKELAWSEKRLNKINKIIALSRAHANHLMREHPQMDDKVCISSNGIRTELFEKLEKQGVERNYKKLIYASSPDRGLVQAVLPLWGRIIERIPDAELHVYYGFDNIDKMTLEDNPRAKYYKKLKEKTFKLLDQPGVFWHGRVGQEELYEAWLSSAIWPYYSDFAETSCICSMESQAGGAIPVTRPFWAVGENVMQGFVVNGSCYDDSLTQSSLVAHTIQLLLNPELQDAIRPQMMYVARSKFSWERIVDQLEVWMNGWPTYAPAQFAFQHRHMQGKTLNIGCNLDATLLRERGAVNLDIWDVDPNTEWKNPIDILADARDLPYEDKVFDTAILGDILEHCDDTDAKLMVDEAKRVANKVIITCPEDYRGEDEQTPFDHVKEYTRGISGHHAVPMTKKRLLDIIGGKYKLCEEIRYDCMKGFGLVIE